MPTRISPVAVVLTMMLLTSAAACRSSDRARATDTVATASAASSAAGDSSRAMAGSQHAMGGMQDTVVPRVQAHLQRLSTAAPDSLRALVPADREVVTALIADCEQMMRAMKMEPPQKWRNAVRDLRQDLAGMASMTATQLQQAMPAHRKRIEGMLAMRHDMMKM